MFPKAILYILIAVLAFSIMNICAKDLSEFHAMQVVFFRAFGTFIFMFPYMLWKGISLKGKHTKYLMGRSILGLLSLAFFFLAIQRIPLGSAISIRYIGPIIGAIIAMFWLKEKITTGQWISFLIAFSGVTIIKGFDLRIDISSFLLVLSSALCLGGVFALIRFLSTRENILTIINYFMSTCIIASLFFISYWRLPKPDEYLSIGLIGIMGLIGQVTMTKAFSLEKASVLAPFKYMELVFAMLLGYLLFAESYTFMPLLGMSLIIGGMLTNLYFKENKKNA